MNDFGFSFSEEVYDVLLAYKVGYTFAYMSYDIITIKLGAKLKLLAVAYEKRKSASDGMLALQIDELKKGGVVITNTAGNPNKEVDGPDFVIGKISAQSTATQLGSAIDGLINQYRLVYLGYEKDLVDGVSDLFIKLYTFREEEFYYER